MKHSWSFAMAVFFLLGMGVAERYSFYRVQHLKAQDKLLAQSAKEMSERIAGTAGEQAKYEEIERLTNLIRIQDQGRWETDSTRVIRSFGETAANLGVKLVMANTVPPESSGSGVAGGAYQRMRIETRLHGSFWGLVQYVNNIERSAQPMVIESFTMTADHDKVGTGELLMTVSALYPTPPTTGSSADATTGGAR